jgi:hypothetical protein
MCEIYRNSALTIAATASSSSDGRCFSKAEENHMAHKIDGRTKNYESFTVFGRQQLPHTSPLLARGWAYQERHLWPEYSTLRHRNSCGNIWSRCGANVWR